MLALISWVCLSQSTSFPPADIDKLCETFMSENHVVGMSVAVIANDRLVYAKGYGDADSKGRRASDKTIYRLGSVSKPVAAAAAMRLAEAKKLDIDADIRKYAPEFPQKKWPVTARQIMAHVSGIRHYLPGSESGITKTYTSSEAINLFAANDLLFEPGTKRSYSTHAFTVLARAIEVAGGSPFPEQVGVIAKLAQAPTLKCEILTTVPADRSKLFAMNAQGVRSEYPIPENNSWKYAGGGLESSAPDLARFGSAMLNGRILKRETVNEVWKSHDEIGDRDAGLGWFLIGDEQAEHGGSQQGCRAHLRIFRKAGVVVAVLTNTSSSKNNPSALTQAIGQRFSATSNR